MAMFKDVLSPLLPLFRIIAIFMAVILFVRLLPDLIALLIISVKKLLVFFFLLIKKLLSHIKISFNQSNSPQPQKTENQVASEDSISVQPFMNEVVRQPEIKITTEKRLAKITDKELSWLLYGMDDNEFENYIANLFTHMGYVTKSVGGPHDGGKDIILKKDEIGSFVQCKHYKKGSAISSHAVRDFYGAIADEIMDGGLGYFVTTGKFSADAKKFAENKNHKIVLLEITDIIRKIREYDI